MNAPETLLDACREIMNDTEVMKKYSLNGISSAEMLTEIRAKHKNAFPLATVIDVATVMREFYGPGHADQKL